MASRTQRYHDSGNSMHGLQLWSPISILGLCEDGRCIGHAPSKGRKCQMPIGYWNASTVSSTLTVISRQPPEPERLRPDLIKLAEYGLCRRFHQYQLESLVEAWMRRIRTAFPTVLDADLHQTSAIRQQLSRQISDADRIITSPTRTSTPSSARTSTISRSETSESDSLHETIATMQETIRSAQECIERLSNNRSSSVQTQAITRVSTSDISSLALSRRSTTTTDLSLVRRASSSSSSSSSSGSSSSSRASTPSPITQAPHRPVAPSPPPATTASRTTPEPALSTPSPCTLHHARRIPLPTECPICQTGPPLSSLPASSLTWCKSRCGQTVHKECFDHWSAQRTRDGLRPTCVMCRADWVDACDCQGCLHVPRRDVEDECAICKEDMTDGEGGDAELVWCKDGCGRSVHRVCFGVWESHCVEAGGTPTCVLCRAAWSEECGC